MRIDFPEFGLEGELLAQGEDIKDRWKLRIVEGWAECIDIEVGGKVIRCPNCSHEWIVE